MKVQEIKLQYNDKMAVQDAPKITQSEEAVEVFRKYMKDDLMYRDFRGQINTILFRMGYPQLPKQRWKLR